MLSDRNSGVPCWYAIHTRPREEDRAETNLRAWGVETFAPRVRERHHDRVRARCPVKPLFPRYIFARFDAGRLLQKVRFTRGVHNVVSFGDGPARVDDRMIALVQSRIEATGFVRLGEDLTRGDTVIIQDGPLSTLIGVFERELKGRDRVIILLSAVSCRARVAVDRSDVKKIACGDLPR